MSEGITKDEQKKRRQSGKNIGHDGDDRDSHPQTSSNRFCTGDTREDASRFHQSGEINHPAYRRSISRAFSTQHSAFSQNKPSSRSPARVPVPQEASI